MEKMMIGRHKIIEMILKINLDILRDVLKIN